MAAAPGTHLPRSQKLTSGLGLDINAREVRYALLRQRLRSKDFCARLFLFFAMIRHELCGSICIDHRTMCPNKYKSV